LHANLGQRLKAVEAHLADEEVFLANYSDGLTDLRLPTYLEEFRRRDVTGSFLCAQSTQSFHLVDVDDGGLVRQVQSAREAGLWINGGFFVFKREILDVIEPGEELVEQPFARLIERKELLGYRYTGFWSCMDTFKDKQRFDEMEARGDTPWKVWKTV